MSLLLVFLHKLDSWSVDLSRCRVAGTITPIVHVQLVRRQELFEAEMLVVPKPHKLEIYGKVPRRPERPRRRLGGRNPPPANALGPWVRIADP